MSKYALPANVLVALDYIEEKDPKAAEFIKKAILGSLISKLLVPILTNEPNIGWGPDFSMIRKRSLNAALGINSDSDYHPLHPLLINDELTPDQRIKKAYEWLYTQVPK